MNCKNCTGKLTKTKDGTYKCALCNAVYVYEGGDLKKARLCKACSSLLRKEEDKYVCTSCGKKYNIVKPRSAETATPSYSLLDKSAPEETVEVYIEKCPLCGYAVDRIKKSGRFKCKGCEKEFDETNLICSVPVSKARPEQIEKAIEIREAAAASRKSDKSKKKDDSSTKAGSGFAFVPAGSRTAGYVPATIRATESSKKSKKTSAPRISGATSSGKSGIVLGIIFTVISVLLIAFKIISLLLSDKIDFISNNTQLISAILTLAIPVMLIIYYICASITARKTLTGLGMGLFVLVNAAFVFLGLDKVGVALEAFGLPAGSLDFLLNNPSVSQFIGFDGYMILIVAGVALIALVIVMIGSVKFEKKAALIVFGIFAFLGCAVFTVLNCSYLEDIVKGVLDKINNPLINNLISCVPDIFGAVSLIALCGFMAEHDRV